VGGGHQPGERHLEGEDRARRPHSDIADQEQRAAELEDAGDGDEHVRQRQPPALEVRDRPLWQQELRRTTRREDKPQSEGEGGLGQR
jgi:hypothetical protein